MSIHSPLWDDQVYALYSSPQRNGVSGISWAFWTRLCRLLPANGTTWLIDWFLQPPSHLLSFRRLPVCELSAGLKLTLPLEKHFLDPCVFARQTKGKWINLIGPDRLFWKILCWVHHSTKSERNTLYFCQNKKLIFNKEFKNAFPFSKLKLQPFQSGNSS